MVKKQRFQQSDELEPNHQEVCSDEQQTSGLGAARHPLIIIFLVRTALNTAHRVVYPFLPSLARGLSTSLSSASLLVTIRFVSGLAAPFIGPLAERHPRRRVMEFGLCVFVIANLVLVAGGTFAAAAFAFALYGLSKVLYDPVVHSYVGDTVPYAHRGRAVGFVELSWSAAWLLGVPLSGILIERIGWRAPWIVLAGVGLLGIVVTRTGLPPGKHHSGATLTSLSLGNIFRSWTQLLEVGQVRRLLLVTFLLIIALEIPFIVYGAWLETSFGLSLSTLGLTSVVVGLAEAAAEIGTTMLTDRWGKQNSGTLGLLGLMISLLLLPILAQGGLLVALTGVVLMMLSFEFAIVSLLPLITELVPDARASLLSLNITAMSMGRLVGSITGGWLWQWKTDGIATHALAGACCALGATLLLRWGIRDISSTPTDLTSIFCSNEEYEEIRHHHGVVRG